MYKLIKLLFVFLLTAGFSIIGCSSDDNPAGTNDGGNGDTQHDQALVATWNLSGYIVNGVSQDFTDAAVTFNADGTGLYIEYSASGTSGSDDETSTFHWSTAGGTQLTIVHDVNNETDIYGYAVQGDGLSLSWIEDNVSHIYTFEKENGGGGSATVAGNVYDVQTSNAIEGANIVSSDGHSNTTDSSGHYSITVGTGSIEFTASKTGYQSASHTLDLTDGEQRVQDFQLAPETGGDTGTVYGDVTDSDSNPLENVIITADDANYTMTDQDGHYSFNVTEGSRTLVATLQDYEREIHSIEVVADQSYEWSFTMTESVAGSGTVYGDVTDSDSNPLENVIIATDDANYTLTDQDGHYSFSVTAGNRGFGASLNGYNTETTMIDVVAGGSHEWSFTMTETGGSSNAIFTIELHWNMVDNDLDNNLLTPEIEGNDYHVYYNEMGSEDSPPYARLLEDHTSGPGPEIIEVYQLFEGTYRVYAYDNSAYFGGTDAKVQFKDADGNVVETVLVTNATRQGDNNDYWHVANFEGSTRAITVVNQLSDNAPEFYQGETPKKPK